MQGPADSLQRMGPRHLQSKSGDGPNVVPTKSCRHSSLAPMSSRARVAGRLDEDGFVIQRGGMMVWVGDRWAEDLKWVRGSWGGCKRVYLGVCESVCESVWVCVSESVCACV